MSVPPPELDPTCTSCDEGDIPEGECPRSIRPCGHHCNHSWEVANRPKSEMHKHTAMCHWCGKRW